MVGRRHQVTQHVNEEGDTKARDDLESGTTLRAPKRSPKQRFRDAVATGVADARRAELKAALKSNIEQSDYQCNRKSLEEIKQIKNKKVRSLADFTDEQQD